MIKNIFGGDAGSARWIDVVDPSREELQEVARVHGLAASAVKDCLEPEHLPKVEAIGDKLFVIVRTYDDKCCVDADTIQELTRKIAIFIGQGILITVHRSHQVFLTDLQEKWSKESQVTPQALVQVVGEILDSVVHSYERPIDDAVLALEGLEERVFRSIRAETVVEDSYFLKRRASVIKRMLRLTIDLLPKVQLLSEQAGSIFLEVKESADNHYFYTEELYDNVNNILNLQLSLASHRTNEVMRVLTVFSAFFMPLTFIVGVYGMNFEHMPELKWHLGYPSVMLLMALTALSIWIWFRRKGWLK